MQNNIRQRRRERGLKQEDLAAAVGVTRQTVIAIENEKYNPSLEMAFRLGKFLEKPVEELFFPGE